MVPSWSAALSSMRGIILMVIGRHRSVTSIGVTSLHARVKAHVLVLYLAGHALAAWTTSHVSAIWVPLWSLQGFG